jgi:hypothetical protein
VLPACCTYFYYSTQTGCGLYQNACSRISHLCVRAISLNAECTSRRGHFSASLGTLLPSQLQGSLHA